MRVISWIVLLGAAAVAPSSAWSGSPVSVTLTTAPTSHEDYAPRNVVAVWVENDAGAFVKTLLRYGVKRAEYLIAWEDVALDRSEIDGDPDVITGATRSGHGPLTVSWNLVDWQGNSVEDGIYTIRMELTDHNSSSMSDNNEGSVTVNVDGVPSQETGMQSGGFSNISVTYTPETAPGPDAGSGDGGPGSVTPEECATTSACVGGDGCCPIDCVVEVDEDCDPDTAQSGRGGAGCSAAGSSEGAPWTLWLVALVTISLASRRRASFR